MHPLCWPLLMGQRNPDNNRVWGDEVQNEALSEAREILTARNRKQRRPESVRKVPPRGGSVLWPYGLCGEPGHDARTCKGGYRISRFIYF